jgi:hypothetical protein
MAVTLTGPGGLFTRLGHIFGGVADIHALYGASATDRVLSGASWITRGNTITADYAAGTPIKAVADGLLGQLVNWQGSSNGFLSQLNSLAQATIIKMVDDDAPLQSKTLANALAVLIAQMADNDDSVNDSAPTIGPVTAVGSPNGTPAIVVSVKDPKGQLRQYVFPETLTFKCISDSQQGATLGQEAMLVTGKAPVSDPYSYLWPGGSGVQQALTAVDGSVSHSSGGGNRLQNSDFKTLTTPNYPDNWVILTGNAGTDILDGSAAPYTANGGALRILGNGSTLSAVYQPFGTTPSTSAGAGGTAAELAPNTLYAVSFWSKVSAVPAAGVLRCALTDGSNTVVNDDAGTANSFSVDLTAETTSYANHTGVFITPAVLPPALRLQLGLTTALEDGTSVYVGRLALTPMTELYRGGPWASVFSGATKLINGLAPDAWTVAVTMAWGLFQQYFERFFGMRQLGLQLPYATGGAETVADSLIV